MISCNKKLLSLHPLLGYSASVNMRMFDGKDKYFKAINQFKKIISTSIK
jgi:hypothetical protein